MKKISIYTACVIGAASLIMSSCTKVLDQMPQTQTVRSTDSTSTVSATDAENAIQGLYDYYKTSALEFSVFDRTTNGDVLSDNCYAGGDNSDNITEDNFTFNSLNGNINRDYADAYAVIGRANIIIHDVARSVDQALTKERKNQIVGEATFMRAFNYFDLVRLYGRVPLKLQPSDNSSAEALLNSSIVPQSGTDTIYSAILTDLWNAKEMVGDVGANPSKYIISKGAVYATLAKVYATMATPNWDSVAYYCDKVIPSYNLVSDYNFLWDNAHKNNSEAIWEMYFDGPSSGAQISNWVPSIYTDFDTNKGVFIPGSWKKFSTPTNDLANLFTNDGDNIRLNASMTFVNATGLFTDANWDLSHYPLLTKFRNSTSDFYLIRLADILLLRAEAYVKAGDIGSAMTIVTQIRARVNLGPKTATSADDANQIIANERRQELAFEGHRWFDLLRTGKAIEVMNAQKNGSGTVLYNVAAYRLLFPIPQNQIDLNPKLVQNPSY